MESAARGTDGQAERTGPKRILLISGSPRERNTEFVLRKVYEGLSGEEGAGKELLLLREKEIGHCTGCLGCEKTGECPIEDGMRDIYGKLEKADVLVIGTPNYFNNVPGLLKDLIDRCNPYYFSGRMKGKKAVFIVVGGCQKGDSAKVADQALRCFSAGIGLGIAGSYAFSDTDERSLRDDPGVGEKIAEIISGIESIGDAPAGI